MVKEPTSAAANLISANHVSNAESMGTEGLNSNSSSDYK